MICQMNNENFYVHINEHHQLLYQSTVVFDENGIVQAAIDIVDCIFSIGLYGDSNEYQISNGMFDILFFFILVQKKCLCVAYLVLMYSWFLFTCLFD